MCQLLVAHLASRLYENWTFNVTNLWSKLQAVTVSSHTNCNQRNLQCTCSLLQGLERRASEGDQPNKTSLLNSKTVAAAAFALAAVVLARAR